MGIEDTAADVPLEGYKRCQLCYQMGHGWITNLPDAPKDSTWVPPYCPGCGWPLDPIEVPMTPGSMTPEQLMAIAELLARHHHSHRHKPDQRRKRKHQKRKLKREAAK